jgi:hypothetical protein
MGVWICHLIIVMHFMVFFRRFFHMNLSMRSPVLGSEKYIHWTREAV